MDLAARLPLLEAPTDRDVVVRALSHEELSQSYAALRLAALRQELGWARSDRQTPEDFIDAYDSHSLSYGVFHQDVLTGAIRLVFGESADSLPSGKYIRRTSAIEGPCAELSRAVVGRGYRNCGVFKALIATSVHVARANDISRVFVTIVDTRKGQELFSGERFRLIGAPFHYSDTTIAISEPTVVLSADFSDEHFNRKVSLDRIGSLLATVALKIRRQLVGPL